MASILAKLPPPLLTRGRPAIFKTNQELSVSFIRETRNRFAFVMKAAGESPESSTSLSVVKSVQNLWDTPEDRIGVIGLGFAGIVFFWAATTLFTTIDKLPLLPGVLEFIGVLVSSWFVYRYLLYKPDREELFQIINKSLSNILGQ